MARQSAASAVSHRCSEVAFALHRQGDRREVIRFAMAALTLNPGHPSRRGLVSIAARALLGPRMLEWLKPAAGVEEQLRRQMSANPLGAHLHRELAGHFIAQGQIVRGYACLRTARTLARLYGGGAAVPLRSPAGHGHLATHSAE